MWIRRWVREGCVWVKVFPLVNQSATELNHETGKLKRNSLISENYPKSLKIAKLNFGKCRKVFYHDLGLIVFEMLENK